MSTRSRDSSPESYHIGTLETKVRKPVHPHKLIPRFRPRGRSEAEKFRQNISKAKGVSHHKSEHSTHRHRSNYSEASSSRHRTDNYERGENYSSNYGYYAADSYQQAVAPNTGDTYSSVYPGYSDPQYSQYQPAMYGDNSYYTSWQSPYGTQQYNFNAPSNSTVVSDTASSAMVEGKQDFYSVEENAGTTADYTAVEDTTTGQDSTSWYSSNVVLTRSDDTNTDTTNRTTALPNQEESSLGKLEQSSAVQDDPKWYQITIQNGLYANKEEILSSLQEAISPTVFKPVAFHKQYVNATFYIQEENAAKELSNKKWQLVVPWPRNLQDGYIQIARDEQKVTKKDLCVFLTEMGQIETIRTSRDTISNRLCTLVKMSSTEVAGKLIKKRFHKVNESPVIISQPTTSDILSHPSGIPGSNSFIKVLTHSVAEYSPQFSPKILHDLLFRALESNWESESKQISLRQFHLREELHDVAFCPLNYEKVMRKLCSQFLTYGKACVILDLSENLITSLEPFECLISGFTLKLKTLILENNKISDPNQLDYLRGLALKEIVLKGNPLIDLYADESQYRRDIFHRMPCLKKVDYLDPFFLPKSVQRFMCADDGETFVEKFLESYFTLYDSDDRTPLMELYHENALFSLTALYAPGYITSPNARLIKYMLASRNFLDKEWMQKNETLRVGRYQINECISKLPKTNHCRSLFTVDLVQFSLQIIVICVTGICQEKCDRRLIRSFNRVFVLVPMPDRVCIINEKLYITNATTEQAEKFAKEDEKIKEKLVEEVSERTNMNRIWSIQYLLQTEWNFEESLHKFTEDFNQNKVPSEAFVLK